MPDAMLSDARSEGASPALPTSPLAWDAHGSLWWLPSPLAPSYGTGRMGVGAWMCILGKRQQEGEEKETTFQKSN